MTLSEWAGDKAVLSPESAAEPGRWRSYPYQLGIMDAFTDPRIERITVMKSARVGYTKILDHVIAFHMDQDPCPILVIQPTVEDADGFVKDEIDPMLRDTPALQGVISDRGRDASNTLSKKKFPGGVLNLGGANSPRGFRRLTIRVLLFDEVDGYPPYAGREGDQISLGVRRTLTYWNRKIALGSTPTIKGASRIEASFEQSDQRRYFVPCPHCGGRQYLKWGSPTTAYGFKWAEHDPATVYYECEHCHEPIYESYKHWMISNGEWRATASFNGHAGFHIWSAYSYAYNARWEVLVREFLESKDNPELLKTFVNTALGETWEAPSERVEWGLLKRRVENYGPRTLPDDVLYLTAGVDVQDDRLEIEVVGWGAGEESWGVEYRVLPGSPSVPFDSTEVRSVWKDLDEVLQTEFSTASGRLLRVAATCIDSGGHHTKTVYDYTARRIGRRVYATVGRDGKKPIWPKRFGKSRKYQGATVFTVGVDTAKEALYGRFRLLQPGPGYCHFPVGYDDEFFRQITSERVVTRLKQGFPVRVWELKPGTRNEALDCRVLAYAALQSKVPDWTSLALRAGLVYRPTEVDETQHAAPVDQFRVDDPEPPPPRAHPPARPARRPRFRFR